MTSEKENSFCISDNVSEISDQTYAATMADWVYYY